MVKPVGSSNSSQQQSFDDGSKAGSIGSGLVDVPSKLPPPPDPVFPDGKVEIPRGLEYPDTFTPTDEFNFRNWLSGWLVKHEDALCAGGYDPKQFKIQVVRIDEDGGIVLEKLRKQTFFFSDEIKRDDLYVRDRMYWSNLTMNLMENRQETLAGLQEMCNGETGQSNLSRTWRLTLQRLALSQYSSAATPRYRRFLRAWERRQVQISIHGDAARLLRTAKQPSKLPRHPKFFKFPRGS